MSFTEELAKVSGTWSDESLGCLPTTMAALTKQSSRATLTDPDGGGPLESGRYEDEKRLGRA
eukprot:2273935-Rhodomonas_salina.8